MKGVLAILCVMCFSVLQSSAQVIPSAVAQDDYSIIIPTNIPVSAAYVIDMSSYRSNMPDPAKATQFLSKFNKPHVTQNFDFASMELTISLDLNHTTTLGWSHPEWNMNLKSFFNIE